MTFPILVTHANGTFTASAFGSTAVCASAPTREAALVAVRARIAELIASGERVFVDVPDSPAPLRPHSDEEAEHWRETCQEIYRERARQKAEWCAELQRSGDSR
jgi:alpha-D-ribose 1-methylphosphonate 5-phosphate C-P lyase